METMDFSIAKKICVAYNICKGEDIMEPIQKRKNAVAFADAINSIEGVPLSPIARCLSDQWQQEKMNIIVHWAENEEARSILLSRDFCSQKQI